MTRKPIAVLGGGNIGHVMAADLTLAGYAVNFCELPLFKDKFKATLERGRIELAGIDRHGVAKLHRVTLDMEEAIGNVELINVVVATTGHDSFFEEMIPCLRDGQIVAIWAGRFGSFRLLQMLREMAPERQVVVAETNTTPYGGSRMVGPAHVRQLLRARRVLVSTLPSSDTTKVLDRLKELYPVVIAGENVLAVAFSNPALVTMGAATLLNTGRIQYSGGDFYLRKEGITEAVARAIRVVYDEMQSVAHAFGFPMLEYEDRDFRTTCSIDGVELEAPFDTVGAFAKDREPTSIPHRFTDENVRDGLVPVSGLGKKASVPTPLIDALVTVGSVVCHEDFWQTGRTLAKLGLAHLDKKEIIRYVERGVA